MQHAYKVVKESGIEELENELKYRASNPLPMNVSRQELTALARIRAKEELMIVATAMATTIAEDLHMPPIIVKEFLRKFNDRTDVYRMEKDQQKAKSYDFTKGGNVYGRVVATQNTQDIVDETWKIAYRVFMEIALETLENDFQFGPYMKDVFVKEFTKNHERNAATGEQARECLRRCEERKETEQLFER